MNEIKELERQLEDLKALEPLIKKVSLQEFLLENIKLDEEGNAIWNASWLLNNLKEIFKRLDSWEIKEGDYFSYREDDGTLQESGTIFDIIKDLRYTFKNQVECEDEDKEEGCEGCELCELPITQIINDYGVSFYQATEDFIDWYNKIIKRGK